MSTSRLQEQVAKYLHETTSYLIRENYRPEWLLSNRGTRLELDFYIEAIKLAIEVQGAQHYVYIAHFHRSPEGFKQRLDDDRYKRDCCEHLGIRLIEISSDSDMEDLSSYIHPKTNLPISIEERLQNKLPIFRRDKKWIDPLKPNKEYPKAVSQDFLVKIAPSPKNLGLDKQGKYNKYTDRIHLWLLGELSFDDPKGGKSAFHYFLDTTKRYPNLARSIDVDESFLSKLENRFPEDRYKEAFSRLRQLREKMFVHASNV